MANEYYRSELYSAVLCLNFAKLVEALRLGGMPDRFMSIVAAVVGQEPYSVLNIDAGNGPDAPRDEVVYIDLSYVQVDTALNELPTAAGIAPLGRDFGLLSTGAADVTAVGVPELLHRYLSHFRVPCRIYAYTDEGPTSGFVTPEDTAAHFDAEERKTVLAGQERLVLFDGYLIGVTLQATEGTQTNYNLQLSFTHFLSDLTLSSTLSPSISAASLQDMSFQLNPFISPFTGWQLRFQAGLLKTDNSVTVVQRTLGDSAVYNTDFWGAWYPAATKAGQQAGSIYERGGLQVWMNQLATLDAYFNPYENPAVFAKSAVCPEQNPRITSKGNAAAQSALNRIEPIINPGYVEIAGSQSACKTRFTLQEQLRQGVTALLDAARRNYTANMHIQPGLTRAQLQAALPGTLTSFGYRYGLPLPLKTNDVAMSGFSSGYAISQDVMQATFAGPAMSAGLQDVGPQTFWDLLVGQFCPRYGLAIAPMSTRAVILPVVPALTQTWQTVYASEYGQFQCQLNTPTQVRGVILTGRAFSPWGIMKGAPGTSAAALNNSTFIGAYDSCREGQFEFRTSPPWLLSPFAAPFAGHVAATNTTRPAANAKQTSIAARINAAVLLSTMTAESVAKIGNFAPGGAVGGAAAALSAAVLSYQAVTHDAQRTAVAYAKALYQFERLRHRSAQFAGRFRTDIGPGSMIAVEVPSDFMVDAALGVSHSQYIYGMVQRVTCIIDTQQQPPVASTAFILGYVRREAEMQTVDGNVSDIVSDGHPYWGTVVAGVPLVDSVAMRTRLANGSNITAP